MAAGNGFGLNGDDELPPLEPIDTKTRMRIQDARAEWMADLVGRVMKIAGVASALGVLVGVGMFLAGRASAKEVEKVKIEQAQIGVTVKTLEQAQIDARELFQKQHEETLEQLNYLRDREDKILDAVVGRRR